LLTELSPGSLPFSQIHPNTRPVCTIEPRSTVANERGPEDASWIVSTVWPKRAPIFFALASIVGFSRICVGAHHPRDLLLGAALGVPIAEAIRRPASRFMRC
jgi:hypothetical protein